MKAECKTVKYLFLFVLIIFLLMQSAPLFAEMKDYCLIPPYVKRDVSPNILMIMDNAKEMGNEAYPGNYDPDTTYSGYFKTTLNYTYGSNSWEPDATGIYSGNILNWATTSKYDLLQSILVGGISASRISNINTLKSISTSWEKTLRYNNNDGLGDRSCVFIVNTGNVEIKDDYAGSCGYLDTPTAHPFDPATGVILASRETGTGFAMNTSEDKQKPDADFFGKMAGKAFRLFSHVMDFLVPDAEAAKPLAIAGGGSSLSDGTECTAYTITISASGGTENGYTWSIIGSLPSGLTIAPGPFGAGVLTTTISGTVTALSGTYNFTVQVTDSGGATDTKDYSITIDDSTITITSNTPLQDAYTTAYYYVPINAEGACDASYTIAVTNGSLPPQFSTVLPHHIFHSDAGLPSTAGTYTFTITVTDSGNNTDSKEFSITVLDPSAGLSITSGAILTDGIVGSPYFIYIESGGGTASYSWLLDSGSLPPGLSLTGGTSYFTSISGTPTVAGVYTFTIRVTDGLAATATKEFTLTVTESPIPVRSTGNLNVWVCAGNYDCNCNTFPSCADADCVGACSDSFCPGECVLKTGIIDMIWPQARLGLQDFNEVSGDAIPNIGNCIESNPGDTPDPNFLTAVENAVPIDPTTTLVNGEYTAVDYYQNNTAANCDPFRDSEACQKNFILMLTSGVGADNPPAPPDADVYSDATNCGLANYKNLTKNSCYGYNNDLRPAEAGRQYVSTYIVNTMGTTTTQPNGQCDPTAATATTGDILCQAAVAGGGVYFEVTDPSKLRETLIQAFQDILKRAAAGTAASVLASGEGSGANLIQAVFYPRRQIGNNEIAWTGRLSNFWYFVDPRFSSSSIYEDDESSDILDLTDDNKVNFFFDIANEKTMAHRYEDGNNDGFPETILADLEFEKLNSLWEAGLSLWERDISSEPRTIYIPSTVTGTSPASKLALFSTGNASLIKPYLDLPTADLDADGFPDGDLDHDSVAPAADVDDNDASKLISYIHGEDFLADSWMRGRTVPIDINESGTIDAGETNVWKLGDILNSTPKVSSWIPLNNYHDVYGDKSYGEGSANGFINNYGYPARGMVFAGGNDGMLHAFKLGTLEVSGAWKTSDFRKAQLSGTDLGEEVWAFIPTNVLPYLKYLAETDYCHVYSIDLTPYVFDASIGGLDSAVRPLDGSTWRTILIGGMRFGGACRDAAGSCNSTTDGLEDCIKTPVSGNGFSSYFALDVTNQNSPVLLWEFSSEDLGLTTTGPAIVRVGESDKNGKFFVVVGSGPTGPISKSDQQFLGHSDQNFSLFILDLNDGSLVRTIDTGIPFAFGGSLLNSTFDTNPEGAGKYQDNAVYTGYVKKAVDGTWTQGGVGRLLTNEDTNPANWKWSIVMDNIGPVTSSVTKLLKKTTGDLWLFFGTGRYYYEQLASVDDENSQRSLFGIKDPCHGIAGFKAECLASPPAPPAVGALDDVTDDPDYDPDLIASGWRIDLDPSGNYTYYEGALPITRYYRAERVITDPLVTSSGLVFFTTYKPYSDVCAYGGKSFIWALRYNTGGAGGALLKGIALLQVSTGSIEQLDLATAFANTAEGKWGRRTTALEGVPPTAQGLSLLSTPPPVKRTIHMRER